MKIAILGMGTSDGQTIPHLKMLPAFRKASLNMMRSHEAISKAMSGLPSLKEAAFILGSSYGELENTKEFLKTLTNTGVARPLLFQSSLHNGTLGFLALDLSMTGPSFTVSQSHFTGEKALELAVSLLKGEIVPACLVSTVDVMSTEILPAFQMLHTGGNAWKDGAWCIVLASEEYAKKMGLSPIAYLESVKSFSEGKTFIEKHFNDSDALGHLIEAIQSQNHHVTLTKPDGSYSEIKWSKP